MTAQCGQVHVCPLFELGDSGFLLKHNDSHKATFDNPIDMTDTRYAIPVRLLKVSVLGKNGAETFSATGQQVDVDAITD